MFATLISQEACYLACGDQCMFGLVTSQDEPMRKGSGFLTNNSYIAQILNTTCDLSHTHQNVMGRDRGASINRSRMAQKYQLKLIMAILAAFANSIGLSHDLLYVMGGQKTIEAEDNFELNLMLSGELAGDQALPLSPNVDPRCGLSERHGDQGRRANSEVCPDKPSEAEEVQDLLALGESEEPESLEPAAGEKESIPGSHHFHLRHLSNERMID